MAVGRKFDPACPPRLALPGKGYRWMGWEADSRQRQIVLDPALGAASMNIAVSKQ